MQHGVAYLREPIFEIVVVGDARYSPRFYFEERTAGEAIRLTVSRGQPDVGFEILSQNQVFCSASFAVQGGAIRQVGDHLGVTVAHTRQEAAESLLADLSRPLVDVVDHVVREQFQQEFVPFRIESCIVLLDQGNRFGGVHERFRPLLASVTQHGNDRNSTFPITPGCWVLHFRPCLANFAAPSPWVEIRKAPTMKPMFFRGRWVLITGASSGLGEAMARELAHKHGANLVVVARRGERLEALKAELEAGAKVSVHVVVADLAEVDQVDRVFAEATTDRQLYAAVLNAGVTHFGNWDELDWTGFLRMQAVNNTSVTRLVTHLLPYFEQQNQSGGILLVASMAGLTPLAYQAMYSATKAFLVHLGASLHHEMWPRNVSVSTFVPGGIDTEMTSGKRFNSLRNWMMPAAECAREGIDALQYRRYVHAPGLLYRWGGMLTRLLPQRFFTGQVAAQYRRSLQTHR